MHAREYTLVYPIFRFPEMYYLAQLTANKCFGTLQKTCIWSERLSVPFSDTSNALCMQSSESFDMMAKYSPCLRRFVDTDLSAEWDVSVWPDAYFKVTEGFTECLNSTIYFKIQRIVSSESSSKVDKGNKNLMALSLNRDLRSMKSWSGECVYITRHFMFFNTAHSIEKWSIMFWMCSWVWATSPALAL